jgi:S-formylglutathione hydrolase FrmB
MAFFECHFASEVLGLASSAHVLIPQRPSSAAPRPHRTLYLLHGLSDDHTAWMRRTSIERYAEEKQIAVVMPAVARSFYQDMACGPRYWTFLSEELPALMRQFFPLSSERADNFAAGLSMGGYGALRLGLARPRQFAAVASLSGALDFVRRLREAGKSGSRISKAEWDGIAGSERDASGTDSDLYHLARRLAAEPGTAPAIYLSCGTEDDLLRDNRAFHRHLDEVGYRHHYAEGPGAHDWAYWDGQIQRVLEWLPPRQ